MEFLLALQFLTRIPVKIKGKVEEIHMARAMAFFPLAGLIIGLIAGGAYFFLRLFLPSPVCDLLVIAVILMITGNLHLDGLMDTADGIFSGKPRDRMLEIMKDSRIGSHGLAAGVLILIGRFLLLNGLAPDLKLETVIAAPVVGRWIQVYGAYKFPYARVGQGTGSFTKNVGRREFFIATFTTLIVVFVLLYLISATTSDVLPGISFILTRLIYGIVAWILLAGSARYMAGKLGGLTGDTYGTLSELAEFFFLMGFLVK